MRFDIGARARCPTRVATPFAHLHEQLEEALVGLLRREVVHFICGAAPVARSVVEIDETLL